MNPVAFTIFGKDIYWYGIIIALAMVAGALIVRQMFRRNHLDPDWVTDLALLVIPLAIIGARVHYVLWSWEEFAGRPFWNVFAIWNGGLAIWGGIIGGLIGAAIFSAWRKVPVLTLTDSLLPGLALGQAIGRWGNFINQEVYGKVVQNDLFKVFPLAVLIERTGECHWALFFYESVANLIIFALLFFLVSKKTKVKGVTTLCYFIFYGVVRAVLEPLRDTAYIQNINGVPVNMIVSILFAIGGTVALVLLLESDRAKRLAAQRAAEEEAEAVEEAAAEEEAEAVEDAAAAEEEAEEAAEETEVPEAASADETAESAQGQEEADTAGITGEVPEETPEEAPETKEESHE